MRKEIIDIDEKRGIVRVTTADERWYLRPGRATDTGLPVYEPVPSVTWITGHYPKGIGFYKWLANQGWDEAQAAKEAAGDKGSKVHRAISAILEGQEVRYDSSFENSSGSLEELKPEEVDIIKSFLDWRNSLESFHPVAWDKVVFSKRHGYAGSIDLVAFVNGVLTLIDFKTSQNVWTEYELQISAYKHALDENPLMFEGKELDHSEIQLAILQVGYRRNGNHYKWNDVEDLFDLFLTAQKIWAHERKQEKSMGGFSQKDYPLVLSPAIKVEEALQEGTRGAGKVTGVIASPGQTGGKPKAKSK